MRSDMRWLLLLTAIIGIVRCADALKATSLIFGRVPNGNKTAATTTTTTTSSTTSTTVATVDADQLNDDEKKDDEGSSDEETATKPPLTGIPQIDYIWDPNLPRELNGYNLSTYPFLNSVPDNEDIDFKCDGLHDGFYASIKYSCQLYHHCVYGIRHDFLCANFTAFDQKSFICHFVSEVNCKASAKYWFRNDALYKATTTTSTTTTTVAPPPTTSQAPERPLRRPESRRPLRRRRPQHEYYYDDEDYDDDYVEERMNRRRKTNRNRNRRPEYDDEYDSPPRTNYKDDEDDYSFEQRSSHRHRNRNRDNSDDDIEYDRRTYRNRKRPSDKRYYDDDRQIDGAEEHRPHSDGRKSVDQGGKRKNSDRRPPINDERFSDEKTFDDRRSLGEDDRLDDRRPTAHDERQKVNNEESRRSNFDKQQRRRPTSPPPPPPQYDDEYDEYSSKKHREDDYDDRGYGKRPAQKSFQPEIIPKVRSSGATASIFNRPRAPPKINRPVPNNEKKKYEYAPQKAEKSTTTTVPAIDEDTYDEYDYEGEKQQPEIMKYESVDSKKSYPSVPFSQRDQRPSPPQSARGESKQEKLPPTTSFNADEFEDDGFDIKDRVTSIKPQRSTSPKVETMPQQHQQQHPQQPQSRPTKTEYYDKPKDAPVKPNARPALDFNKDEYIPETDATDYADEEVDDRLTKEEEFHQPEAIPTRTEFRPNVPTQDHKLKAANVASVPKGIKEHDDSLPKNPYGTAQHHSDVLQYKTKFHRLSPATNVRPTDDVYQKPTNTEPEERDVYTILPKDTVSSIREPSGFKPVNYNEQTHDFELDAPKNTRPYVRIMKRPFLPSRGGSPYLPRGLKPVGAGITTSEYTTEGYQTGNVKPPLSNIANGQLFGHNLPIPRTNPNQMSYGQIQLQQQQQQQHQSSLPSQPQLPLQSQQPLPPSQSSSLHIANDLRTTTQQPQIESPRSPLDEIFNSDYDVTLNDALNPTLKPLSHSHESPIGFSLNKYDRANPYARSDVSHSSSQYRTTAIPVPVQSRQVSQMAAQQQPQSHQQQQQQQQQQQSQSQLQPQQQQLQMQIHQQQHQQPHTQDQLQKRQPQSQQFRTTSPQYYDDEYDY